MKSIKNRAALLLSLFYIGFITTSMNQALAMPNQNLPEIESTIEPQDLCIQPEKTKIKISFQSSNQKNWDLAKRLESSMVHFGYAPEITHALYNAHLKTGVDFKLLALKAILESDYGRFNVAPNSSARGVFQYIESTWLVLIHRYGDKVGYSHYADAITYNHKTKMATLNGPSRHLRGEILALRHDPKMSALIKAYQVLEETDVIQSFKKGKKVTVTDHYIAHMLGLYVMKDFYQLIERRSVIAPAKLSTNPHMREAAYTNKIFFFKGKKPLTAAQSYKRFKARVERELRQISNIKQAKIVQVSQPLCANEKGAPQKAPSTLKTSIR